MNNPFAFALASSSHSRAWRALRVLLGVVVVAVVLVALACVYAMYTDRGRGWLAHRVEGVVSDAIAGSLVIGSLSAVRVWPLAVDLNDLKILDPNTMTVLHARKATLVVAPFALFRGRLHVTDADVEGGQLVIAIQDDGRTSLEAALSAPSVGSESQKSDDAPLRFDTIAVREYVVELKPSIDDAIRIRVQSARVTVESPPVVIGLHDIQARVQTPQIIGAHVDILLAQGWIHGDVPHILELTLKTAIGEGKLDARLSYFNRPQTPLVVVINPHDGLEAEIAAFLLQAKSWGSDTVEVTFDEDVTHEARAEAPR